MSSDMLARPELRLVVRGAWRWVEFQLRADAGVFWWFSDGLPDIDLDPREQAVIDTIVAAELARRQNQWRDDAAAHRRRKIFGADGPIYRVLP